MAKIINEWSKTRTKTITKAVKNFNAKISRIIAKNPEAAEYLPEKVKVSELKEIIKTESDYRKILNSLKRFRKRGAEETVITKGGTKTTKFQLEEIKRNIDIINKRREKEAAEIAARPVIVDGKKMENAQRMALSQSKKELKNMVETVTPKEFKQFAKWLEKERLSEKQLYKGVYFINDISEVFYASFSDKNTRFLLDLFYLIGGDKLYNLYMLGYDELDPEYLYNEPIEESEKVEKLKELLYPYLTDEQITQLEEKHGIES